MHTVQTNMAKLCTQHSIFPVIMYNLMIFNCLCYEMAKELLTVNSGFLILMCIQFLHKHRLPEIFTNRII